MGLIGLWSNAWWTPAKPFCFSGFSLVFCLLICRIVFRKCYLCHCHISADG